MATTNKNFKVKNGIDVAGSGTFGGTVTVATPTENTHAATKAYVDSVAGGGGGGSSVSVSDTEPESPSAGDLWLDSSTMRFMIYYDSYWIEVSTSTGDVQLSPFLLMGAYG